MEDFKTLLTEYLKQYPNEENPLNWHQLIEPEELYEFLKNIKGRKILLKSDPKKMDSGRLIYG